MVFLVRHDSGWSTLALRDGDRHTPVIYLCRGVVPHAWTDPRDAVSCCNGYERACRVVRDASGDAGLEYFWRRSEVVAAIPAGVERVARAPADGGGVAGGTWPVSALAHAAFLERLATVGEAGRAEVQAGLVVLKLIDRWAIGVLSGVRVPAVAVRAARAAVSMVAPGPIARMLSAAVVAVTDDAPERAVAWSALLQVYGGLLEDGAEWALAADVYGTMIEYARTPGDVERVPAAYDRMGHCLRQLGRLDAAQRAYVVGRAIADRGADVGATLRLRISEANLAGAGRGNWPEAERRLDAVIADAQVAGLDDVLAMARHDRGLVATERGRPDDALTFLHAAFLGYRDAVKQQRALNDIARLLRELGARDAARAVFKVSHECAAQQDVRWVAAINLLDLAVEDGGRVEFEDYRCELEAEPLSARHAAYFAVFVGDGYRRFGSRAQSAAAYQRALAIGRSAGMHEIVVRAESALAALDAPVQSPPRVAADSVAGASWSELIDPIVSSAEDLRRALAVGP
jgi:tetratricopeptide (TPR) repeat protein